MMMMMTAMMMTTTMMTTMIMITMMIMTFLCSSFMQWDVNNEMLHGSYFADREGLFIRDWMYSVAGKIDPDVDLFVNDFDVVENGQLTQVKNLSLVCPVCKT